MAVRDCLDHFLAEPFTEFHHPLLMAGWREVSSLTRECQEVFMSTVLTSYSCKSVMQDTAIKITIDNLSDIRPEKAILSLMSMLISTNAQVPWFYKGRCGASPAPHPAMTSTSSGQQ